MSKPSTPDEYLEFVAKSDLLPASLLQEFVERRRANQAFPTDTYKLAQVLVFEGLLTKYQAEQLLAGRWRNFVIGGKYKLLERLGKGGMAQVFLCEHQIMKRLVALKILPTAHAEDRELLGRFHREARALSQLRHPNIVGAYDFDQANKVHFLVMEYVDGGDLEAIVQKNGPMAWERAVHYIRQAALGLQHAHECGLVHRDVKPGNLLVDRSGTVKLLDLGLARIFDETTDDLTTGRDARTLLGTVDYLAPEQALNSHDVDIRADIYGLGATFYYILMGRGLFEDGTVAQKLSWHLHRPPSSISISRPDVPEGLVRVIERMLAKRKEDRYQSPDEVVEAVGPWTLGAIDPPSPDELPLLSRAARRLGQNSSARLPMPSSKSIISNMARPPDTPSRATKVIQVYSPPEATPPAPLPASGDLAIPVVGRPAEAPGSRPKDRGRRRFRRRSAIGIGVLAVVVVACWGIFGPDWGDHGASVPKIPRGFANANNPVSPGRDAATSILEEPADASFALMSASEPVRRFSTLRESIKAAGPGDRVIVRGTLMVEAIELSDVDGARGDLTLEGMNLSGKGKPVRWRGPADLGKSKALLDASGLEGLRIKGFLFDGEGRVADLVRLSGRGAGSMLEDLEFEGATGASLTLKGWVGESERPSTLQNLRFSTVDEAEAAIRFGSDPDRPTEATEWVRILSCRFVGPYQAALMVGGPVKELDVEQCRFFGANDGLRYRRTPTRDPLRLRLTNNTFVRTQRGIHFETTPPADSSEMVLTGNLFAETPRLATLDKVSVQPFRTGARWIWTGEGKGAPAVPSGVRRFRRTFDLATAPARATLDIGGDETFSAWLNGVEIARTPAPHFTQRVFSFDVSGRLRPGRNVLAVEAANRADRLDSKSPTSAGLLAQVNGLEDARSTPLVKTDETWKWDEQAPEGWTGPEFDDSAWQSARPWPSGVASRPWSYPVWDSAVLPQLKSPLEPIRLKATGNLRDHQSWEGYPTLDAERVAIGDDALPKKPGDDATFLRYKKGHPLATAGPGGLPVGAFEEE